MVANSNEALDSLVNSLVNRGAVMWPQFADTCVNAVAAISKKADKTQADNAKIAAYGGKAELFNALGNSMRELLDQQHGVTPSQTPSQGS